MTDLDRATKGAITSYEAIGPQWGAGRAVHYRDGFEFVIANRRAVTITFDVHFAADEVTASAWVAEYVREPEPEPEPEHDGSGEEEANDELVSSAGPLTAGADAAGVTILGEVVARVLADIPYFAEFGVTG